MKTKATEPRERYDRLVRAAQQLPPVTTAVVHPCDKIPCEELPREKVKLPKRQGPGDYKRPDYSFRFIPEVF